MVGHSSLESFNDRSHIRESLIFEDGLKENLLKNIEVSLEFARCQVDPLQVKEKNSKNLVTFIALLTGGYLQAGPGPRTSWHWKDLSLPRSRQQGGFKICQQLHQALMQVAIQLTGEPGTFTKGILVDVNSQSLCSMVINSFPLVFKTPFAVVWGEWQTGAEAL